MVVCKFLWFLKASSRFWIFKAETLSLIFWAFFKFCSNKIVSFKFHLVTIATLKNVNLITLWAQISQFLKQTILCKASLKAVCFVQKLFIASCLYLLLNCYLPFQCCLCRQKVKLSRNNVLYFDLLNFLFWNQISWVYEDPWGWS